MVTSPASASAELETTNVGMQNRRSRLSGSVLFAAALVALALVAFSPILVNGFVNWDDDYNFVRNTNFHGWGWQTFKWASTTFHWGIYQPLAWLVLLVQYRLWKLDSFGYHLSSLLLYCGALLSCYHLVLALLERTYAGNNHNRKVGLSFYAFAALILFAVHPLRTEAVAWASCQPYLLCLLFSTAAITTYLRAHPGPTAQVRPLRLAASVSLYAAALLSKPAALSLPGVLIALDYYPLKRIGWGRDIRERGRVLAEKVPFLLLSVIFSFVAVLAKREGRALEVSIADGVGSRIAQPAYAVWFYLAKTVWPLRLSHFYGRPLTLSLLEVKYALCLVATLGVTAGLIIFRSRFPGTSVAWICYLIVLAPTLGGIRFGPQIVADRFALLATLPLVVLLAGAGWRLHLFVRPTVRATMAVVAGTVVVLLILLTRGQCAVWRSSESLWAQALAIGQGNNPVVQNGIGSGFQERGRYEEAAERYREALRLEPRYADAHNNLGIVLQMQHQPAQALREFKEAAALDPNNAATIHNLAKALVSQGRFDEAAPTLQRLVQLRPRLADARVDLGAALAKLGRGDEAATQYAEALRLKPDHAGAHFNLGLLDLERNQIDEARAHFARSAEIDPRDPLTFIYLGSIAVESGDAPSAERDYSAALALAPDNSEAHAQLGALLVNTGRVLEGTAHLRAALKSEPKHPLANFTLGQLMAKNARTMEARERYEDALAGHPSHQQELEIRKALRLLPGDAAK